MPTIPSQAQCEKERVVPSEISPRYEGSGAEYRKAALQSGKGAPQESSGTSLSHEDAEPLGSEAVKIKEEPSDEDMLSASSTFTPLDVKDEYPEVDIKEENISVPVSIELPENGEAEAEQKDIDALEQEACKSFLGMEEKEFGANISEEQSQLSSTRVKTPEHREILKMPEVGSPADIRLGDPECEMFMRGHFMSEMSSDSPGASSVRNYRRKKGRKVLHQTLRRERMQRIQQKRAAETAEEREERIQRQRAYYRLRMQMEDIWTREQRLARTRAKNAEYKRKQKLKEKKTQLRQPLFVPVREEYHWVQWQREGTLSTMEGIGGSELTTEKDPFLPSPELVAVKPEVFSSDENEKEETDTLETEVFDPQFGEMKYDPI